MKVDLLIATHNQGKIREFAQLFSDLPLRPISLANAGVKWEVHEIGQSFEANARLKAEAYCAATGLPTLAEDSGLQVDALNGAPGVLTARYGGPGLGDRERYELLLLQMQGVPGGKRQAQYVSVIAIAATQRPTRVARGECAGEITFAPRGDGGFGYDPIFYVREFAGTMAELSLADKNSISHRGRAARSALDILRALAAETGAGGQ